MEGGGWKVRLAYKDGRAGESLEHGGREVGGGVLSSD